MSKGAGKDKAAAGRTVYGTLSLCFSYPWGEVLEWLMERTWISETEASLRLLDRNLSLEHLRSMEEYLSGDRDRIGLDLEREYTRLFINSYPRVPAPPYGSVYMERGRSVYGKTTADVICFYRSAGVEPSLEQQELPDHVSMELEFLGILSGKESRAESRATGLSGNSRREFLSRFVLPWVPQFCGQIVANTGSPFYKGLAKLTVDFLDVERSSLGISEHSNVRGKQTHHTGDDKWPKDMGL
jgi:putative dimethyl sulfoxide reductase chaperone